MSWSQDLLQVNPRAKVTVRPVGRTKLVIADDFYLHPDKVLEVAQGLHYFSGAMHGNFPGARALVSLDTAPLCQILGGLWGAPLEPFQPFQPVVFSVIVNAAPKLCAAQRQPHIDPGVSAMVWLNATEDCAGGTGLYRHRLTGLERIPLEPTRELIDLAAGLDITEAQLRTEAGWKSFQDHIVFNPLFAAKDGYINDGNEFWELLFLAEMRFNRLILFDGRVPHSQHLRPDQFRDHARINQIIYLKGSE
jgi:hypothetical protein